MRVVVVDDHALVRQSFVKTVAAEPGFEVVGETGRGEETLNLVNALHPDIILLDISLPGEVDGLGLAEQLKKIAPSLKIIFLTAHEYESSIRRAIEIGVDGYVPKSATMDNFLEALHAVRAGESYLSPTIARRVMDIASQRRRSPWSLTERELEILCLLAEGARPNEVAEQTFLSVKTIKNHLTSIYSKLGVSTAAQAVSEAYSRKLVAPK